MAAKSSDLHKGFRNKKSAIICTYEMASKDCLTNGWIGQFRLVSFSDVPPAIIFYFLYRNLV